MSRMLASCAAIAITALIAIPAPASAATQGTMQATAGVKQSAATDISAARRHHRYAYARHRYHRAYGYYAPYNAYAYDPYYRPFYSPGPYVAFGPFGFGFGW